MTFLEMIPRPTKTYHSTTYDRISKRHGFDGKGKTVLITGGATGIGYSLSRAFAEAGVARIAIISRSPVSQVQAKAALERAYPLIKILLYTACITDEAAITTALRDIGSIDVLVNCAAVYHRRAKATELDMKDVHDVFDINVVAAFNLATAYLAMPIPVAGSKTIINISSAAGQLRSPLRSAYGPSKAAVTQVMQHLAFEHYDDGVRIFSFHPGAFYTPASSEIYSKDALHWEDINLPAHFALWLAGPESSFLNGRYLWANWDVDELLELKERLREDQRFLTIGLVM